MGLDTTIVAVGPVTDEQIERFNAFLKEREGQHAAYSFDMTTRREVVGYAEQVSDEENEYVEVHTLERLYSIGYERGNWPLIYGTIIAARHHFPDAKILYGSDSGYAPELPEATDEALAEIWAHWASEHGNGYRKPRE